MRIKTEPRVKAQAVQHWRLTKMGERQLRPQNVPAQLIAQPGLIIKTALMLAAQGEDARRVGMRSYLPARLPAITVQEEALINRTLRQHHLPPLKPEAIPRHPVCQRHHRKQRAVAAVP